MIGYVLEELAVPDAESGGHGVHDVAIWNQGNPGNSYTLDADGFVSNAFSHTEESDGHGITMDELMGPTVLYDNPDEIAGAYLGDGTITPWGVDAMHAVMKSRLGRTYHD